MLRSSILGSVVRSPRLGCRRAVLDIVVSQMLPTREELNMNAQVNPTARPSRAGASRPDRGAA
jgi:hypothetical protein